MTALSSSIGADAGNDVGNNQMRGMSESDAVGFNVPIPDGTSQREDQKVCFLLNVLTNIYTLCL